jgi:hypothetical protein
MAVRRRVALGEEKSPPPKKTDLAVKREKQTNPPYAPTHAPPDHTRLFKKKDRTRDGIKERVSG